MTWPLLHSPHLKLVRIPAEWPAVPSEGSQMTGDVSHWLGLLGGASVDAGRTAVTPVSI